MVAEGWCDRYRKNGKKDLEVWKICRYFAPAIRENGAGNSGT